jgi:hypothetical protein
LRPFVVSCLRSLFPNLVLNKESCPMTQAELNQAVADATGESVQTIRRRGFSVVTPLKVFQPDDADDYALPSVVDWDDLERQQRRNAA